MTRLQRYQCHQPARHSENGNGSGGCRTAIFCAAIALCTTFVPAQTVTAQLRIVTYNTATSGQNNAPNTPRTGMDIVLEAIGNETTGGIAKPIDVLLLQEQQSSQVTGQSFANLLNSIYSTNVYQTATLNGQTNGAGRPGLIYNSSTVDLLSQRTVGNLSGSGAVRQTHRYELRPVGYSSPDAEFFIYNSHFKASTGATNESRRNVEATAIRSNGNAWGEGTHIIYAGDFNLYRSSEPAYQTFLGTGAGQAFDPINRPGNWSNSSSHRGIHTQSPYNPSFGNSDLITGGMDDRFDFQLVTGEFLDSDGLAYIPGSYHAFGNNGSHSLNDYINDSSNNAQPNNVLNALASVSDHLPVVADYQVPAVMDVAITSFTPMVLAGNNYSLSVSVSNIADVVAANGADELDYTVTGSGGFAGTQSGSDAALGSGNIHSMTVSAITPGNKTGTLTVTSSNQAVENGSYSQMFPYTVLASANASFDPQMDQNNATVDFGIVAPGSGTHTQGLSLFNLADGSLPTAGVDLDAVIPNGDASQLMTDLMAFQNLAAGQNTDFDFTFDGDSDSGNYSATYILQTSDQDLPGVPSTEFLFLTATGSVALPGDANLDGVVDVSDLNIWSANKFTTGNTWATADFNFDGLTDVSDLNIWSANKFQSLDTAVVPEPTSWPLLLVVGWGLIRRHRHALIG